MIIAGRDKDANDKLSYLTHVKENKPVDLSEYNEREYIFTSEQELPDNETLVIPLPVGSIIPFLGSTVTENWHICDGSAFDKAEYPELYNYLKSEYLPDFRELVLVGCRKNEKYKIETHDVFMLKEFKDDQFQNHYHTYEWTYCTDTIGESGSNTTNRVNKSRPVLNSSTLGGATTRIKEFGINFIIKMKEGD